MVCIGSSATFRYLRPLENRQANPIFLYGLKCTATLPIITNPSSRTRALHRESSGEQISTIEVKKGLRGETSHRLATNLRTELQEASDTTETLPQPPSILLELYGLSSTAKSHPSVFDRSREETLPTPTVPNVHRPYVTLTFAQSLDAKIAGVGGKQLILSGNESLVMTHWMRTLHDGILVGIGTALNDNPQLNTRHLPPLPAGHPHGYRLPRPIILDTHLRLSPECKLLKNYQAGYGRRPWVVCAPQRASSDVASTEAFTQRAAALQAAGAKIIELECDAATGRIAIPDLLAALRELGVRSLMVEGGARVIRSFLHGARSSAASGSSGKKTVDALVVTVAPTVVGSAGIGYGSELLTEELPTFQHVRTDVFGPDTVVALKTS